MYIDNDDFRIEDGVLIWVNDELERVYIPLGVTKISSKAFTNHEKLVSVYIPESVTKIDNNAFSECTSLKRIIIPDSVTDIGLGTFSKCSNLEEVKLPSEITTIGYSVFYDCRKLKNIIIPNKVISIGSMAFENCELIEEINIPDSVTEIEEYAFWGMKGLNHVNIPSSVVKIGSNIFTLCNNLETINIENDVHCIFHIWNFGNAKFIGEASFKNFNNNNAMTRLWIDNGIDLPSLKQIKIGNAYKFIINDDTIIVECTEDNELNKEQIELIKNLSKGEKEIIIKNSVVFYDKPLEEELSGPKVR